MIGGHSVTVVTGAGLFVPSVDLGGSMVYVVWQGRKVTQREHTRGNTIETRDLVARAQLLFRVPKLLRGSASIEDPEYPVHSSFLLAQHTRIISGMHSMGFIFIWRVS